MSTSTTSSVKIFFLLKDPAWDNLKPEKIHLFSRSYLTDGSAQLISDVANYGLDLMRKGTVYIDEYPFSYWTYTPKGDFIDSYVTLDLFTDKKAWTDFRAWFEATITTWCNGAGLTFKIERDQARQFYIKITVTVTPAVVVS